MTILKSIIPCLCLNVGMLITSYPDLEYEHLTIQTRLSSDYTCRYDVRYHLRDTMDYFTDG